MKQKSKDQRNDDGLLARLEECELVINELENSPVWKIVCADLEIQRKMLDNNWQEILEPEKLQKARELKHATLHVLNMNDKYKEELKNIQEELRLTKSTKTEMPKDYDME